MNTTYYLERPKKNYSKLNGVCDFAQNDKFRCFHLFYSLTGNLTSGIESTTEWQINFQLQNL